MATSFSVDVRKWAQQTKLDIDEAVRASVIELASRVIIRSPVDTGRFRANWQIDTSGFSESKTDKSGQATIAAVIAAVSKKKAGGIISLINNAPYGERLEMGYSKQAPQGMVRITVLEFNDIVETGTSKRRR